jgi:Nif-specific regulatory protein
MITHEMKGLSPNVAHHQSEPMKRIEDVTLLYEISKKLNEHLDLKKSLYKVLDTLSISINMIRGTITLLNPLTNEITIEVAHGYYSLKN